MLSNKDININYTEAVYGEKWKEVIISKNGCNFLKWCKVKKANRWKALLLKRANDEIWTRDLFLTKETLYPWATSAKKERETGFEPATFSLEGWRSTNWATPAIMQILISANKFNISNIVLWGEQDSNLRR